MNDSCKYHSTLTELSFFLVLSPFFNFYSLFTTGTCVLISFSFRLPLFFLLLLRVRIFFWFLFPHLYFFSIYRPSVPVRVPADLPEHNRSEPWKQVNIEPFVFMVHFFPSLFRDGEGPGWWSFRAWLIPPRWVTEGWRCGAITGECSNNEESCKKVTRPIRSKKHTCTLPNL